MSTRQLPDRPNLEHLKKQARLLLRESLAGDAAAAERFRAAGTQSSTAVPKLADALHAIAREYGFDSWPSLKGHVESSSDDPVEALTSAVRANDAALVRQVLKRHPALKSRLNEPLPNFDFEAPALIGAVNRGNREMVEVLLDAGADINARTKWWAGSFGVFDGDPKLASFLIERGAYVDIHAAARLGMFDRVKELVEGDPVLVHARGGDGQMPLHFAATVEIAAYLLDHGAEIDARDIDHESTAAQYMAGCTTWPRTDVLRYLISRGAQTDLLMAASLGDLELVRKYLDADPDLIRVSVSDKDFPKRNPHSGGSIYNYTFGSGKTPHMIARQFGYEEVFRLLMECSPLWLQLTQACEVGDEALMRELTARHPKLAETLTDKARRRIVGTAMRNNTEGIRLMLGAGWPADVSGDSGQTPLHWAAWHGNVAMVGELLRHRAPLEAQENEYKATPLGWAIHGSEHGWHRDKGEYGSTVEALLAAGAKAPQLAGVEASEEVLAVLRRHSG
ncbi:MAG TPA: ankyrin repeat domain-containing protein [Edaphobacter sp.]|nr:ankyrin repeat domain-containing protein [Edaphobacter sp.]